MSTDHVETAVQPAAIAAGPPQLSLGVASLEAGDFEDIEEYTGRADVIPIIFEAFQAAEEAEAGQELRVLFTKLPTKVFTALLGVARRHHDPSWTQDKWRTFRFADLFVPADADQPNGNGQDPTSAAPPRSRKGNGPRPRSNSTPEPNGAAPA